MNDSFRTEIASLESLLKSDSDQDIILGLTSLASSGSKIANIVRLTTDALVEPRFRSYSLRAIASLGPAGRSCASKIVPYLASPEDLTSALHALSSIGAVEYIEEIEKQLHHPEEDIWEFAARAIFFLGSATPSGIARLISLLEHEDWDIRYWAAVALAKVGDQETKEKTFHVLKLAIEGAEDSYDGQHYAAASLKRLGTPEALTLLKSAAEESERQQEFLKSQQLIFEAWLKALDPALTKFCSLHGFKFFPSGAYQRSVEFDHRLGGTARVSIRMPDPDRCELSCQWHTRNFETGKGYNRTEVFKTVTNDETAIYEGLEEALSFVWNWKEADLKFVGDLREFPSVLSPAEVEARSIAKPLLNPPSVNAVI